MHGGNELEFFRNVQLQLKFLVISPLMDDSNEHYLLVGADPYSLVRVTFVPSLRAYYDSYDMSHMQQVLGLHCPCIPTLCLTTLGNIVSIICRLLRSIYILSYCCSC
jgi:hypothetical protein